MRLSKSVSIVVLLLVFASYPLDLWASFNQGGSIISLIIAIMIIAYSILAAITLAPPVVLLVLRLRFLRRPGRNALSSKMWRIGSLVSAAPALWWIARLLRGTRYDRMIDFFDTEFIAMCATAIFAIMSGLLPDAWLVRFSKKRHS